MCDRDRTETGDPHAGAGFGRPASGQARSASERFPSHPKRHMCCKDRTFIGTGLIDAAKALPSLVRASSLKYDRELHSSVTAVTGCRTLTTVRGSLKAT